MKKTKNILIITIFLLSSQFSTAHGGFGPVRPYIILFGGAISLASTVPLAATPYLFKDNDTGYSYMTTLGYAVSYTFIIPAIVLLVGGSDELLMGSLWLAPILGTVTGFNKSKIKITPPKKKEGKEGWYIGLSSGISRTNGLLSFSEQYTQNSSIEIGYGFTKKFLVYLSGGGMERTYLNNSANYRGGIGASYYISNNQYIKLIIGNYTVKKALKDYPNAYNKFTGSRTSFGYGNIIYKQLAIEVDYTILSLDDDLHPQNSADMISVLFNYRWF